MSRGPLGDIVVLDLTRVLAGPFATMLLYDLGARVIKVERPDGGDDARGFGPFANDRSAYFASLNRGKESIALDLKLPADRAVFERLVARADVLVENFRPGAMKRLGYGGDALTALNPGLVCAAASGFGQTGPYASRAAYDLVVQGMGGIMSITGHPGAPPTRVGTSIGDLTAGLFTALGVATALFERARTGRGAQLDVSMLDCQVAILENAIARYVATGDVPGPLGSRHPSITPFEAYATADGHLVIAAGNDALFARVAEVVGRTELMRDARFATNALRTQHVDALRTELEGALRVRGTHAWLEDLHAAGVPCGPIQNVAEVLRDPQIQARNMVVPIADERDPEPLRVAGNPIKNPDWPDPTTRPAAPDLDADRETILEWLDAHER